MIKVVEQKQEIWILVFPKTQKPAGSLGADYPLSDLDSLNLDFATICQYGWLQIITNQTITNEEAIILQWIDLDCYYYYQQQ